MPALSHAATILLVGNILAGPLAKSVANGNLFSSGTNTSLN